MSATAHRALAWSCYTLTFLKYKLAIKAGRRRHEKLPVFCFQAFLDMLQMGADITLGHTR